MAKTLLATSLLTTLCLMGAAAFGGKEPAEGDRPLLDVAKVKQGRNAVDSSSSRCTSIVDGHGERVRAGLSGPSSNHCRADNAHVARGESRPAKSGVQSLSIGAPQLDQRSDEQRRASPIAARLSAGRVSATLITTGTAVFLLQSSLSTYLLMLGLPFWRHVDLLPIVDAATEDDGSGAAETESDREHAVVAVLGAQEDACAEAHRRP